MIAGVLALFLMVSWVGTLIIAPDPNPKPFYKGELVSAVSDQILRNSCFDCHSNETVWPWYANVPPMSFLVHFDVKEGREHLNFSNWDRLTAEEKSDALKESLEEVEEGHMPLPPYILLHPDSVITSDQLRTLKEDIHKKISHE